ncbi:DUF6678 family protein [Capnocytophaga sp.]|uniref:DUF6678 family protein n=1 Tax=Capnocytophaga sp. TaxID=44737 RepID=UPI0026DBA163|nr:DUF6678 family protein [Capnocytophaga sp.]MDO5106431.1 hypothetical protein [Capnocytophaga sp.]
MKNQNDLNADYNTHLQRVKKEIAKRTSFMSNAKWHKLNEVLKSEGVHFLQIKFLLDEKIYKLRDGLGYVGENYVDTMIGVFQFQEVEWIFIPKVVDVGRKSAFQAIDLEKLEAKLNQAGQFRYEKHENGLKICAYGL